MRAKLAFVLTFILLGACTTSNNITPIPQSPQTQMVHIAKRIQACWFKSKDPRFKKFKMASEVNSYAGKPRVLIVPKNKPSGLPKLVVQSERVGGSNVVSGFGPLLQTADGLQLKTSVDRWAKGNSACA